MASLNLMDLAPQRIPEGLLLPFRAHRFIKPLIRRAFKIPSAQTGKVCRDGRARRITQCGVLARTRDVCAEAGRAEGAGAL